MQKWCDCEPMSLLSIRGWWVRYVTMWDTTLQQLFNEVSMLRSCIDEDWQLRNLKDLYAKTVYIVLYLSIIVWEIQLWFSISA